MFGRGEGKCLRFCVGKYYVVLRMTYSIVVAWRHSSSCFIDSYQPAAIHGHDVNYKYVYYAPRRRIPSSSYTTTPPRQIEPNSSCMPNIRHSFARENDLTRVRQDVRVSDAFINSFSCLMFIRSRVFSRFFCFSYLSFVHCLAATLTFCILQQEYYMCIIDIMFYDTLITEMMTVNCTTKSYQTQLRMQNSVLKCLPSAFKG